MKTITMLMRGLGVVALVLLVGTSVALAHGTPTMSAQPGTVAAGGKITLSGDGMGEDAQTVTFTLKGMLFQAPLGTAKLQDDAFDGATFTIPAKAPPGTYLIVGQNGAYSASVSIEVTVAAPAKVVPVASASKPTAIPTTLPTVIPTAMPTAMAAMTTPAPTVTQVTAASSVATDQTNVATPIATTESSLAQSVAATPAVQTSEATSVATAVVPAITTEEATQPDIDVTPPANAPADQTTGAIMPMPGEAPVLVRVRTPIQWALPIGGIVVAGGLGLFLITRHW